MDQATLDLRIREQVATDSRDLISSCVRLGRQSRASVERSRDIISRSRALLIRFGVLLKRRATERERLTIPEPLFTVRRPGKST